MRAFVVAVGLMMVASGAFSQGAAAPVKATPVETLNTTAEARAAAKPVDEVRVPACRIGKPSYCYKYGGTRCPKLNTLGGTPEKIEANCEAWTGACLACHGEIPDCLGKPRPKAGSTQCTVCHDAWLACMDKNDAKFWPNRMTKR
jgi:hypothetical protein